MCALVSAESSPRLCLASTIATPFAFRSIVLTTRPLAPALQRLVDVLRGDEVIIRPLGDPRERVPPRPRPGSTGSSRPARARSARRRGRTRAPPPGPSASRPRRRSPDPPARERPRALERGEKPSRRPSRAAKRFELREAPDRAVALDRAPPRARGDFDGSSRAKKVTFPPGRHGDDARLSVRGGANSTRGTARTPRGSEGATGASASPSRTSAFAPRR